MTTAPTIKVIRMPILRAKYKKLPSLPRMLKKNNKNPCEYIGLAYRLNDETLYLSFAISDTNKTTQVNVPPPDIPAKASARKIYSNVVPK